MTVFDILVEKDWFGVFVVLSAIVTVFAAEVRKELSKQKPRVFIQVLYEIFLLLVFSWFFVGNVTGMINLGVFLWALGYWVASIIYYYM